MTLILYYEVDCYFDLNKRVPFFQLDSGLNFGLSIQKQVYSDLNLTQESSKIS